VIIQVTTHYTKFNPMCKHVHSKVTYQLKAHQFTVRQVGKGGKECGHSSYHSLHKFNPMCKHVHSKVTYSLKAHQYTAGQVGKGGKKCGHSSYHSLHKFNPMCKHVHSKVTKNLIIQVTTRYTKFNPTCRHAHSKVTYQLKVHQFTVRQVGKGGKEWDYSSYHSLHKIQSYVQTCPFKGNLPTESAQVHSVASGKRRRECDWQVGKGGKECDHSSYHSLHKIQSYVQTCPFKGNLLAESAPVRSAASGERRQRMWSFKLPLTTQNSVLHANMSIQR